MASKMADNVICRIIKQDTDNVFGTDFSIEVTRIIVEMSNI